jgi:hypothetical protein
MGTLFTHLVYQIENEKLWEGYAIEQLEARILLIRKDATRFGLEKELTALENDPELFKKNYLLEKKLHFQNKDFNTVMANEERCSKKISNWTTLKNPGFYPRLNGFDVIEPYCPPERIKASEDIKKAFYSGNYTLTYPDQGLAMICVYLRIIGEADKADEFLNEIKAYCPNVDVNPGCSVNSMDNAVVETPVIDSNTVFDEIFLQKLDAYIEFLFSLTMPGHPELARLISRMRRAWMCPDLTVDESITSITVIPGVSFLFERFAIASGENSQMVLKSVQGLLLQYITCFVETEMSNEFIDRIASMLDIIGLKLFFLKNNDRLLVKNMLSDKLQENDQRLRTDDDLSSSFLKLIMDFLRTSEPSAYYLNLYGIRELVESLLEIPNPELVHGYEILDFDERSRLLKDYLGHIDGILKPIYSVLTGQQSYYSNLKGLLRRLMANNFATIFHFLKNGGFMSEEGLIELAVSCFKNLWMKICSRTLKNGKYLVNYKNKDSISYFLSIMPDSVRQTCVDSMLPCLIETNQLFKSTKKAKTKQVSSTENNSNSSEGAGAHYTKEIKKLEALIEEYNVPYSLENYILKKNFCGCIGGNLPLKIKSTGRWLEFNTKNMEHLRYARSNIKCCKRCSYIVELYIAEFYYSKSCGNLKEETIKQSDTNANNIRIEVDYLVSELRMGSFLVREDEEC